MKKHNPIVSIATTALLIIIVLSFSFTAHAQNSWRHLYATTDYPEAIEFVSNTTGFAVGANGYLIKTTDGGITWDTSSLSLTDTITAIAFADANKGLIVTSAGFIYRTVDAGVNWDSVGSNGTSDPFHDVVFPNTGTAYAGGDGFFATKLYNSTDGGATWVQKNYTGADIISIGFRDGISGFLTNVNGEVQATNNSGATWIPMILASSTTYYDVEFSSSLVAYACGSGGKVIKTVNAGVSWDTLITGTTEQLNKIHTFSDDSLHIAGVNGTLLVTSNGGASWSSGYAGTEHLYDLAYGPDSSYALSKAGSTGNILKYTIPPIDTTSIVFNNSLSIK